MEEQIKNLETKIDLLSADIKKLKRYFALTFWITIALVVLPVIGLAFAIPSFLSGLEQVNSLNLGL